jgi:hypothetical protein
MDVLGLALDEAGEDILSFPNGPRVRAVNDEAVRRRYYARIAEKAGPNDTPQKLAERQRKAFNLAIKHYLETKQIIAKAIDEARFLWLPA